MFGYFRFGKIDVYNQVGNIKVFMYTYKSIGTYFNL